MSFMTKNLLAASMTTGMLCLAQAASAGSVQFADPVPNAAAPNCGGISYEWTVSMDGNDEASFVRHVGAKSWNEPPPGYALDNDGWTHSSEWLALELTEDAMVEITLARQDGVIASTAITQPLEPATTPPTQVYKGMKNEVQRNMLVPAMSVFQGWEESSCEDHRYLNDGQIEWMKDVTYLDNVPNWRGKEKIKYRAKLKAGKYSVVIGGNPERLDDYAVLSNCGKEGGPDAATCYKYTGRHGYRVEIETHGKRHRGKDHDHDDDHGDD